MGKEVKTTELVEDAPMRVATDGAADVAAVCAPDGVRSRKRDVVETLCLEIGFPYDPRLERQSVLVAFVAELVDEVASMHRWKHAIAERLKTPAPSESALVLLKMAQGMVLLTDKTALTDAAAAIHDLSHVGDDEECPADRLAEMISSCASAIRFGLEHPHMSRHAAAAAQHIWKTKYGVSLFDGCTPTWEKEWARQKLQSAIVALATATPQASNVPDTN